MGGYCLDHADVQLFGKRQHVLLVDEAHFQIELGELWLTIGPHVFVAEAASYLEVALNPRNHQQLFQLLWRLGESVKRSRMQTAGHQEVPSPFRGALDEYGCLDFEELPRIKKVPDVLDHPVAQDQILLHRGAPKVKVAVAETEALVSAGFLGDVERRGQRLVEHRNRFCHHFEVAGRHRFVFTSRRPLAHMALHLDDPFLAEVFRGPGGIGGQLRIEDHLNHAGAIPQIQEDDSAVVPASTDPSGKSDLGIRVCETQVTAVDALHSHWDGHAEPPIMGVSFGVV